VKRKERDGNRNSNNIRMVIMGWAMGPMVAVK